MWFEARKQERKIKCLMIDRQRRAERRRLFYEQYKKDPQDFIQVHGSRIDIKLETGHCVDTSTTMRKWQGDESVLIDRFDARSHLDFLPDPKANVNANSHFSTSEQELEERSCNYERFRILVTNDYMKVSESKFLKEIHLEERFGSQCHSAIKSEQSKQSVQKAAIGYSYSDEEEKDRVDLPKTSSVQVGDFSKKVAKIKEKGKQTVSSMIVQQETKVQHASESDNSDSAEDDEDIDLDVNLNVSELSGDDCRELNKIASNYQMPMGDFVKFLVQDSEDRETCKRLRQEESEREQWISRTTRRERKMVKDARLSARKGFHSPLSFVVQDTGKQEGSDGDEDSESHSSSPGKSPEQRIEFISSFGGDMETTQHDWSAKRPKPQAQTSHHSSHGSSSHRTPSSVRDSSERRRNGRESSKGSRNSRSKSRDYYSRHRRRSSSQSRRDERSHSSSRKDRDRYGTRISRSRSRSRHRSTSQRNGPYRSSSPRASGRYHSSSQTRDKSGKSSRDEGSKHDVPSTSNRGEKQRSPSTSQPVPTTTGAVAMELGSGERKASPAPSASSVDSNISFLSIRSSLSESEREQREVENRRRRLKKTKHTLNKSGSTRSKEAAPKTSTNEAGTSKELDFKEKLRRQRQKALRKTYVEDKREEKVRQEIRKKQEMEREEELRGLSLEIRKRNRGGGVHGRSRERSSSASSSSTTSSSGGS